MAHSTSTALLFLALCALLCAPARAGAQTPAPVTDAEIQPILARLGIALKVTQRPPWPQPPGASVEVTLVPQGNAVGTQVVSFGLPFGPGVLWDDGLIRATDGAGQEIPVFTRPIVHWWIDGRKGALRSVLVQLEAEFRDQTPQRVTVTWDRARTRSRPDQTPVAETQFTQRVDPPANYTRFADPYEFQRPKVLALLPPEWLSASLVTWQQTPAGQNRVAPWYDAHLLEHFEGSLRNISANRNRFEAHLFDRPATYAKVYVRHGAAEHLLATMQAGDFYIQQIGPDGFFGIKAAKDHKYVYTEGSAILYMLTGDERYREAIERAIRAWDTHTGIEHTGKGFWTERHTGFGMMAYLHAYEVTGEQRYLEQARRYFEAALSLQVRPLHGKEPDGAWLHTSESHGEGQGWITSPWMSSFLTDAIWKYWMLTGDPRSPASLAMYANFIRRHGLTPGSRSMYYLASSPGLGRSQGGEGPEHNVQAVYLMALGYYLSGGEEKSFLEKIETLWPPAVQDAPTSPGRKFTWRFRETSKLIWYLQAHGSDQAWESAP